MKLRLAPTILALLFCLLLPSACYAKDKDLVIGAILPLSGPAAAFGLAAKNGLEMALSNASDHNVRVIYEDNELSSAKTVSAFRKLTELDNAIAIVSISATTSNAIAPLAEQKGVLLLASASDRSVSRGRFFVIRTWCAGFEEGQALANAIQKDGYRNIGIVMTTSDYHSSLHEGIVATLADKLVLDDEVTPTEQDFGTELLRAKTRHVDAMIALLGPGQLASFAKKAKNLNLNIPLYGAIQFEDPKENQLADGALSGSKYVTAWNTPDFAKRYAERYPDGAVVSLAAAHYEIGRLLSEYRGPRSSRDIRNFFVQSVERKGALGNFSVKIDGFGAALTVPVAINRVN